MLLSFVFHVLSFPFMFHFIPFHFPLIFHSLPFICFHFLWFPFILPSCPFISLSCPFISFPVSFHSLPCSFHVPFMFSLIFLLFSFHLSFIPFICCHIAFMCPSISCHSLSGLFSFPSIFFSCACISFYLLSCCFYVHSFLSFLFSCFHFFSLVSMLLSFLYHFPFVSFRFLLCPFNVPFISFHFLSFSFHFPFMFLSFASISLSCSFISFWCSSHFPFIPVELHMLTLGAVFPNLPVMAIQTAHEDKGEMVKIQWSPGIQITGPTGTHHCTQLAQTHSNFGCCISKLTCNTHTNDSLRQNKHSLKPNETQKKIQIMGPACFFLFPSMFLSFSYHLLSFPFICFHVSPSCFISFPSSFLSFAFISFYLLSFCIRLSFMSLHFLCNFWTQGNWKQSINDGNLMKSRDTNNRPNRNTSLNTVFPNPF